MLNGHKGWWGVGVVGRGLNPIREGAAMSPRGEISEIENLDYSAEPPSGYAVCN